MFAEPTHRGIKLRFIAVQTATIGSGHCPPAPAAAPPIRISSTFFWLHYLFNIPIIGFIAAIVFSFVGGNISRKNYARSRFIWHLIWIFVMLLIALAVILVFKFFGGAIKDILTDLFKDSIKDRL